MSNGSKIRPSPWSYLVNEESVEGERLLVHDQVDAHFGADAAGSRDGRQTAGRGPVVADAARFLPSKQLLQRHFFNYLFRPPLI
jgi:hypothetical protein